ncbi:MAG: iron-sulfur cluster assembly scaffold protein [Woeseiaceae bacterium]
MTAEPYSARVRELFAAPAHAGDLESGQSAQVEAQDLRLRLSAVTSDGAIATMRFRAWGCPHSIAAAEAACNALEGQPVAALLEFSAHDLMEYLSVPVEKTGRILVLEDAVRSLGLKFRDGP